MIKFSQKDMMMCERDGKYRLYLLEHNDNFNPLKTNLSDLIMCVDYMLSNNITDITVVTTSNSSYKYMSQIIEIISRFRITCILLCTGGPGEIYLLKRSTVRFVDKDFMANIGDGYCMLGDINLAKAKTFFINKKLNRESYIKEISTLLTKDEVAILSYGGILNIVADNLIGKHNIKEIGSVKW